jgi:hypothetical protein
MISDYDCRVAHPTDIIYTYFQGDSCLPDGTLDASTPCTPGGDPSYVIKVSTPEQISAAIHFAREYSVRLIVKNTGHDVSGKSTGAGSLSIWTHNMKQIDWLPEYETEYYSGAAIRIAAGVSLEEYYQAAEDHGVTVVGGECSVSDYSYFSPAYKLTFPDCGCCRWLFCRWRTLAGRRSVRHGR